MAERLGVRPLVILPSDQCTVQLQKTYETQLGDRVSISLRIYTSGVWPSPQSHARNHGWALRIQGEKVLRRVRSSDIVSKDFFCELKQGPLTNLIWLVRKTSPDQVTLVSQEWSADVPPVGRGPHVGCSRWWHAVTQAGMASC